jgi:endogenous inhibitor of DNA gyrase (YacG/DUF329 family)
MTSPYSLNDFLSCSDDYAYLSDLPSPSLVLDDELSAKAYLTGFSHSTTTHTEPYKPIVPEVRVAASTQTFESNSSSGFPSRQCPECSQFFVSHKGMKQHMAKAHMNLNKQTKCPLCFKAYKHRFAVRFHIKQVHEKATRVECPKCKKTLYNKYILSKHMEAHAN